MIEGADAAPDFEGWDTPRFTPVPDELFDVWMAELNDRELRVLLYIMRRTYGFKKQEDGISFDQMERGIVRKTGERLDRGTGLKRRAIQYAVAELKERGLVEVVVRPQPGAPNLPNLYRLRMKQGDRVHQRASSGRTTMHPQETDVQDTVPTPPGHLLLGEAEFFYD